MTEFLKLLAVYYMCDSAAAIRPLITAEMIGCQQSYETVKTYFSRSEAKSSLTPLQIAARNRAAYVGFKTWESEKATLVAQMRKKARAKVSG